MVPSEYGVVVALLLVCLVALILVSIARREAAEQRARAESDVAEIKDEARSLLADARRRVDEVVVRERAVRAAETEAVERAHALEVRAEALHAAEVNLAEQITAAERSTLETLESISGLSADEARATLMSRLKDQVANDGASLVRRTEVKARRTAEARARRILSTAVQRVAGPTSAQSVVSVLSLPSEEMKGRIIGKEGRNIRAFEALTGVNVLVDESLDSVTLSSFDPERREVAQVALEALIADGRINPQRIEAAYADALAGAEDRTMAAGHEAAERAGVGDLHPDLITTLGRLRLRTSYGQNVLNHLVECAQIAAVVAAEIGADVDLARRAAFLHDIGKARPAEIEGTHALIGAELARRAGESASVVNAIAAHHDEVPSETIEAVLVQAADAASAARPGARREELDQYIERVDRLEQLVVAHPGVRRALAMSAGREVRVVVEPSEVGDVDLPGLAVAIARHIEADLTYPGEIKVTVVREIRASATAG